jgi:hypothetical protein
LESSIDGGSCSDSKSEYRSFDESDKEANNSDDDGGSEGGTQTGIGVRSSLASKPATKKVCSLLPLLKRSVFAMPSLDSGSSHVVQNARIDLSEGVQTFSCCNKDKGIRVRVVCLLPQYS